MDDAQLRTVWQQRQMRDRVAPLTESLGAFMKYKLARRVKQLGELAGIWDEVIPEQIASHTALERFNRGVLTVLVDSSAHRYQLQTLLSGGVQREIQRRFSGAITKIRLTPGQFSFIDLSGAARYEF